MELAAESLCFDTDQQVRNDMQVRSGNLTWQLVTSSLYATDVPLHWGRKGISHTLQPEGKGRSFQEKFSQLLWKKKKINKKMEAMPRKIGLWEKPRRAFLWRKFTSGVTDGACWGEPWQELYQGAEATPARGPSRPGHPQCPSARAGNQRCSVISLSSLSSLVK